MSDKDLDFQNSFPKALPENIRMGKPNEPVGIYEGEYIFRTSFGDIQIIGSVVYKWVPNRIIQFSGNIENGRFDQVVNGSIEKGKLVIQGNEFAEGFLTDYKTGGGVPDEIEGYITNMAIFQDVSVPIEKVRFSVPNLRFFQGDFVRKGSFLEDGIYDGRSVFEDDDFQIIIEKYPKYSDREKKLKDTGGYHLLYNGEILSKKGKLYHDDLKDLFKSFSSFLSFLNGRKTSILFLKGIKDEKTFWIDYSDFYFVDSFNQTHSWPVNFPTDQLADLWISFRKLWRNNKEDKDFLHTAILWYTEANASSKFGESSIIMAQTALELMYNWWIVEKKKMILGNDSNKISASNKVRLLISQANHINEIPEESKALIDLARKHNFLIDAPEVITYIRNAIVHSDEKKMEKIDANYPSILREARTIYLWYIEVILLNILKYKGEYKNRCTKKIGHIT